MAATSWLDQVKFDEKGLIPAIAVDHESGRVLMAAWMTRETLARSVETGKATYFSRSRQTVWEKGEESGNTQRIHEVRLDCDADVLILDVTQEGGIACHTGRQSCFFRKLQDGKWVTTDPVLKDPKEIYGNERT